MFVNFNILNQLGSPAINSNTFANRPAAGQTGRLFVSTDTFEIYRDNGTTWDLIGGPGSSTITGTGTATQVAYFTSSQSIGSSSNLFWDATNNRLGLGTQTPGARLDIHSAADVGLQLNGTGASPSILQEFLSAGVAEYDLGYVWNADVNYQRFRINDVSGAKEVLTIDKQSRFVGINYQYSSLADQPAYNLDVNGSGRFTDNAFFAINSGTNAAIGTTLANWGTTHKALQIQNGSLHTENNDNDISLGANLYYDNTSTLKYIVNDTASLYRQDDGQHLFYRAISGLANNNITLIPSFVSTNNSNFGIKASTTPVYALEVSADGGSERIRVGTLQNNNNTASLEAITSAGVSSANSAWLRVNYGSGLSIGVSSYTKVGGDSGNFANLSNEIQTSIINVSSSNNVLINDSTDIGQKLYVNGTIFNNDTHTIYGDSKNLRLHNSTSNNGAKNKIQWVIEDGSEMNYIQSIRVNSFGFGDMVFFTRGSSVSEALRLNSSQNVVAAGSITTGAPSGGTAAAWKFGSRVAATVVVNTTEYIELDIGGTLYKLATVT